MRRRLALALSGALALACGDGPASPPPPPKPLPGTLRVLSGGDASDSARARLASPLVLQVLGGDGKPAAGVALTLTSRRLGGGVDDLEDFGLYFLGGTGPDTAVTLTTDAQGKASIGLAFGAVAGTAVASVRATSVSLQDSVRFAILPGAAVALRSVPHDTAVILGRDFTVRYGVVDANGNVRSTEPVSLELSSPVIRVDAYGKVHGASYGRTSITFSAGTRKDTTWVSVVPDGVLAVIRLTSDRSGQIVTYAMDGSDQRVLAAFNGWYAHGLSWAPDGKRLLFDYSVAFHESHLYSLEVGGTLRRLFPDSSIFSMDTGGVFSGDSEWIYFSGWANYGSGYAYRVRANGSGVARVSPPGVISEVLPAPSPDGTRLATVVNVTGTEKLVVRDLASGASTVLRTLSRNDSIGSLSWSPKGDLIAFMLWYDLYVVRPDGSGMRSLEGLWRSDSELHWSPDGKWLLASTDDGGGLVDVATGAFVLLPRTRQGDVSTAWRP